jgi:aspartyl-tRNA(Asn)/glutamyl-tRNA(Gln) amidotransferase subunit B
VARLNLAKTADDGLDAVIEEVTEEHPQAVEDFHNGRKEALNFLVGQVMRKTRGRVDPGDVNRRLREILSQGGT